MTDKEVVNEDIDLLELVSALWASKIQIICTTIIAAVISVVYALSLPNLYTSSALLAPSDNSGAGLSGMLNQYSGLASMAGVSLPGGGDVSKAALALEVVQSRAFAHAFIKKHDILPELMAVEYWRSSDRTLMIDSDIYNDESGVWNLDEPNTPSGAPSDQEAVKAFRGILSASQDKLTRFVTISITHMSPDIAKNWVNWLVQDLNETMRQKEIKEGQQSIEYLKRQAAETALADLDQVFYELMQAQMQRTMLAQVRREYALTTIDPAISPEIKSAPRRAFICLVGVILGGMIGVGIAMFRYFSIKAP